MAAKEVEEKSSSSEFGKKEEMKNFAKQIEINDAAALVPPKLNLSFMLVTFDGY